MIGQRRPAGVAPAGRPRTARRAGLWTGGRHERAAARCAVVAARGSRSAGGEQLVAFVDEVTRPAPAPPHDGLDAPLGFGGDLGLDAPGREQQVDDRPLRGPSPTE
ncbi:MAG: hypothetical protein WD250_15810 [Egibacteraceae bacterium]